MRIKEAVTKYLAWKTTHANKAPLSYAPYLETFCKVLHNKEIEEITIDDIATYHRMVAIKHSPATVAYAMTIIKNFIRYIHSLGKIQLDPFMVKVPRFVSALRIVATDEEVKKISSLLDENSYSDLLKLVIIKLLHDTGCRVSELCEIKTLQVDHRFRRATIITKKSYRPRIIMWSEETNRLLIKYLGIRICLNQKPGLLMGYRSKEFITPRSIQKWLAELCDEANIRHLNPHSFRHHKAHEILQKCPGDIKSVQQILGHSNPASSFKYLQYNEQEQITTASRFL